ncbi:hypothetical protein CFAM422_008766 [Trichoderma lentiforme]|uniref:CENP-V/GFA domain-containing protein n=1 Tax=Trichoderma lentiforme TaxID=1567552 RepID=A0A9P5CBY1_9HYPO|nr:hypothetical protein CFAM422_008766 [Trichoderma lentiforme]
MSSYSGTCNCGSITITLNAAPSATLACHCQPEGMPGKYFVKASLFDDIPSARTDIFLERKIHWEGDVEVSA